jgi:hypothetical protein
MTITKANGQGSGGKGLLITALTSGTAQTLHTAVAGTATTQLFSLFAVNNSASAVQLTVRFEPLDASAAVEVTELIPAMSGFTPLSKELTAVPLNDTMVVKVYADTASTVAVWGIVGDQASVGCRLYLPTGEVTLVQNTSAFRMNGVASSATEADHQLLVPVAGTITNLRARALTGIGGGAEVTVTVRVNGADTALSFTYAAADTTTLKSDTDSVAVVAGDLVTINFATDNAGAPADTMYGSLDFVPAA